MPQLKLKQNSLGIPSYYFDNADYQLVDMINNMLENLDEDNRLYLEFSPELHPRGIKEFGPRKSFRIAYAIVNLLGSLNSSQPKTRISALETVIDEVLNSAQTPLVYNTARILLEIMKKLVRVKGNFFQQLRLAHDFHQCSKGKPITIHKALNEYGLLPMPEEWNQFAFDDHVHDATTKGRKSPTHLLMDAWIKGVRILTVVYYNYITFQNVKELLDAAKILNIEIHIGIQMQVRFHEKYVRFVWEPIGLNTTENLRTFLSSGPVADFMVENRKTSKYHEEYIFKILDSFNKNYKSTLEQDFDLIFPNLNHETLQKQYVGQGQASANHLSQYIHTILLEKVAEKINNLKLEEKISDENKKNTIQALNDKLTEIDAEYIKNKFLRPVQHPQIPSPNVLNTEQKDIPPMLLLSLTEMFAILRPLRNQANFTLLLDNIDSFEVLEILYDCRKSITHLEICNLKNLTFGTTVHIHDKEVQGVAVSIIPPLNENKKIAHLQQLLNTGNVVQIKQYILELVKNIQVEKQIITKKQDAKALNILNQKHEKLIEILLNIAEFSNAYQTTPLQSKIGSCAAGYSRHRPGMGILVQDTLPRSTQKILFNKENLQPLPIKASIHKLATYGLYNPENSTRNTSLLNIWKNQYLAFRHRKTTWVIEKITLTDVKHGNLVPLGKSITAQPPKTLDFDEKTYNPDNYGARYFSNKLVITLKLLIGFIPAFLTFYLTKDAWFLAWFGAFIWFGITGVRNILQAIFSGNELHRSPLLKLGSLIYWNRIVDSLMYTGLSVPLLDYLAKTIILSNGFGITIQSNPLILYSVMGIINAVYIYAHNTLRGLSKITAIANLFRSILAIPVAIFFSYLFGLLLIKLGVQNVDLMLQNLAAIISKFASDSVAGIMEGLIDLSENMATRKRNYQEKIEQIFNSCIELNILLPQESISEWLFLKPTQLINFVKQESPELYNKFCVHALDMLYFWMYQPRARTVFKNLINTMPHSEVMILLRLQFVLHQQKEISKMFIDGLLGKKFAKGLAFYLNSVDGYLNNMEKIYNKYEIKLKI